MPEILSDLQKKELTEWIDFDKEVDVGLHGCPIELPDCSPLIESITTTPLGLISMGKRVVTRGSDHPTTKKTAGIGSWIGSGLKIAAAGFFAVLMSPILLGMKAWEKVRETFGLSEKKILKDNYKAAFEDRFKREEDVADTDPNEYLSYSNYNSKFCELSVDDIRLSGYTKADFLELEEFEIKIERFSKDISQLAKDPEKMRAAIVKLSKHPGYQKFKHIEHRAILFLQECGMRLESANVAQTFREYGEARIAQYLPNKPTITFSDFADALEKAQLDFAQSSRDNPLFTTWWGAQNLGHVLHVEDAHLHPEEYDSYQNHIVGCTMPLRDGEHHITLQSTPGLTGKRSIAKEVLIPALRKEGRRWVHIDHQGFDRSDEAARLREVHSWTEEQDLSQTFFQAVIPTDMPKAAKQAVKEFKKGSGDRASAEKFIEDYITIICGENGQTVRNFEEGPYYIPRELLNDDELAAVLVSVQVMISGYPRDLMDTPAGREQFANIIQRTFNATLSWAIMKKEQLNHENSILSDPCKENNDRGPSETLFLEYLDDLCKGESGMPSERAHLRAGELFARAEHSMNRAPQASKFFPVLDSIRYLDVDPRYRDVAQQQLQWLRAKLLSE